MRVQGLNSNGEPVRNVYVEKEQSYGQDFSEGGRTRQEFADECDINVLLARYEKTGVLNHYASVEPVYMDLSEVPDLQESLLVMREAERAFMTLPAIVRREFDNDAVKFLQYAQNPENIEQIREWKLAPPLPQDPAPVKVEVINPPPADAPKG